MTTIKSFFLRKPVLIFGPIGLILLIAALFSIIKPSDTKAAWYNSSWGYRKTLTIDNTKVSGSSNLTDFPVLVSITDADLATDAQADGDDILFTSADGTTILAHEIETYVSGTGTLVAWVKVPTLSYNVDTVIYMYYGNAGAASQQNPTNTWNSAYVGVWHMKEDPSASAPQILDSTSNNRDGTSNGTMTSGDQVTGQMNGSLDFDGTDDYISTANLGVTSGVVSFWMKPATTGSDTRLFSQLTGSPSQGGATRLGSGGIEIWTGSSWVSVVSASTISASTWYHVALVYSAGSVTAYVNGVQKNTVSSSFSFSGPTFGIGARFLNTYGAYYNGVFDEFRVATTAITADWLITEYNNQSGPSTFLTVGSEEAQPPNTPTLDSPADTATATALSPVLRTTATDPTSDYIRYKIELCTNVGMTTGCQTFDQTSSQTGWSGQNTQTSTAYTSGTQGIYTLQSALTIGTTYYWRSYAIDPGGTNTWSGTQGSPFSFTVSNTPTAPTLLEAEGATNPTAVTDLTPEFTAIYNDSDTSDTAIHYEIEVNTLSDFSGTSMWDTGQTSMASLSQGLRSVAVSYAGTALTQNGTTYYWRIRFWDSQGLVSPFSSTASFTMNSFTGVTSCTLQRHVQDNYILVLWNDTVVGEDGFGIERNKDSAGFASLTSVAANTASYQDTAVTVNSTYQYRIRSTSGASSSDWCTTGAYSFVTGSFEIQGVGLQGINID